MSPAPAAERAWRARAKVNLTLRVVARRPDGWHDLHSVVAFAGRCDWLWFNPDEPLGLEIGGPTSGAAGDFADNLVLRAARELKSRAPGIRLGRFVLRKELPVAAGLGGGSADAAAALLALADANGLSADDTALWDAARATGADVPVCLAGGARVMTGRGEILGAPLRLPPLFAVLANPGIGVSTPAVFQRLGLAPGQRHAEPSPAPSAGASFAETISALRGAGNDLEAGAISLAPVISEALAALADLPGAALARMSGSGATCFALFENPSDAARGARALGARYPGWWVRGTALR